ncbi:MAG: 1-deoxy-D-xylulose-5-phosphate reductoisomerase [Eubacteriales bacterium]|nr:1-deoxy-D-xylulose-5-phosphate reductoisomerase [Eubacteriales bacterium]
MLHDLTILGSTGSIGRQALDVCRRLQIYPRFLSCHREVDLLAEQIKEFRPRAAVVTDPAAADRLTDLLSPADLKSTSIYRGEAALLNLVREPVDRILVAISGFAALAPCYEAIQAGRDLALANKEAVVVAGDMLLPLAREQGVNIYPVDSEHSAIWQCLAAAPAGACRSLYLTASGGPFRTWTREQMAQVSPQEALAHPVWSMGAKISIDSASMMNKGLEIIEAMQLFSMAEEDIQVLIHPEGLIHSMVEFKDGAIMAQLGMPDMRLPIQLALTWPERLDTDLPRLNFFAESDQRKLNFFQPDPERFPALQLARRAAREGKEGPLVLNAANEVGVEAFLAGQIKFTEITDLVARALDHFLLARRLTDFSLNGMIDHDQLVKAYCRDQVSILGSLA